LGVLTAISRKDYANHKAIEIELIFQGQGRFAFTCAHALTGLGHFQIPRNMTSTAIEKKALRVEKLFDSSLFRT